MTEEKDINTTSVNETTFPAPEATQEVVTSELPSEGKNTDRAAHKSSNLRGRWKRNSAGTATIKEDESKLSKEIKAVKLATAECITKNTERKRISNNYEKAEKHTTKATCCCCSFLCKIKRFILSLLGIEPKKEEKRYSKNPRGPRYPNQRRRTSYRNTSRNPKQ